MARVVRRGGRIVCAEPDWGTFFVSAPMSATTRAVEQRWVASFRNPWIGRELPRLLKAHLERVEVDTCALTTAQFDATDKTFDVVQTVKLLEQEEATSLSRWLDEFRESRAIAGVTLVLCYGTRR
jgi:hypothetical protein